MTEKYVASGIFEGKAWTLHYDDESASYRTVSFPADPQFHAAGDRVSYYMDPDLTGTIAEVKQITTLEAVYAVYWDTDEPTMKTGWYTYSMLKPLWKITVFDKRHEDHEHIGPYCMPNPE